MVHKKRKVFFFKKAPLEDDENMFPAELRIKIYSHLGRQECAMMKVACGQELDVLHRMMLREPFTCWDWHGTTQEGFTYDYRGIDEISWQGNSHPQYGAYPAHCKDQRWKRQLIWEHQKPFAADGQWHQRLSPRERWEHFKLAVTPEYRQHVKKIAIPFWMPSSDIGWIKANLVALEGLDLSNTKSNWDSGNNDKSSPDFWMRAIRDPDEWTHPGEPYRSLYFGETFDPRLIMPDDINHFTCLTDRKKRKRRKELERAHDTLKAMVRKYEKLNDQASHQKVANFTWNRRAHRIDTRRNEVNDTIREFQDSLIAEQRKYDEERMVDQSGTSLGQLIEELETSILTKLKWLGIGDWRGDGNNNRILRRILPRCVGLETLSIRNQHYADRDRTGNADLHENPCSLLDGLSSEGEDGVLPDSVKFLELRLYMVNFQMFLRELKRTRPQIERVGIDIGAWIQTFPLSQPGGTYFVKFYGLNGTRAHSMWAAQSLAHQSYKKRHKPDSEWLLPAMDNVLHGAGRSRDEDDRRWESIFKRKQHSFYSVHDEKERVYFEWTSSRGPGGCNWQTCDKNISTTPETLGEMFQEIYAAEQNSRIRLFALEPEVELGSQRPIHPFTLIEPYLEPAIASEYLESLEDPLNHYSWAPEIYYWLNYTFKWRPIFDWDWLMVKSEMINPEIYPDEAYPLLTGAWAEAPYNRYYSLKTIEAHFRWLKEADIPIHLLIGRRDTEKSSCYWGRSCNEHDWQDWLRKDENFDSNLYNDANDNGHDIAQLVDTLSIIYDLRNPLERLRLSQIERKQPYEAPHAKCPFKCRPWKTRPCPFTKHSGPTLFSQRMANRKRLEASWDSPDHLADTVDTMPPIGEVVEDSLEDNYYLEEMSSSSSSLHQLARKAIFCREAIGWHRFWNKYAARFTRLTELNIRMPHSFDKTGSWSLAKLLDINHGWEMMRFSDERQHLQTSEDLVHFPFPQYPDKSVWPYEHLKEEKVIPGGRFVRRRWTRRSSKITWNKVLPNEKSPQRASYTYSVTHFPECDKERMKDNQNFQENEKKEYQKGVRKATAAAMQEQDVENRLSNLDSGQVGAGASGEFARIYESELAQLSERERDRLSQQDLMVNADDLMFEKQLMHVAAVGWNDQLHHSINRLRQEADSYKGDANPDEVPRESILRETAEELAQNLDVDMDSHMEDIVSRGSEMNGWKAWFYHPGRLKKRRKDEELYENEMRDRSKDEVPLPDMSDLEFWNSNEAARQTQRSELENSMNEVNDESDDTSYYGGRLPHGDDEFFAPDDKGENDDETASDSTEVDGSEIDFGDDSNDDDDAEDNKGDGSDSPPPGPSIQNTTTPANVQRRRPFLDSDDSESDQPPVKRPRTRIGDTRHGSEPQASIAGHNQQTQQQPDEQPQLPTQSTPPMGAFQDLLNQIEEEEREAAKKEAEAKAAREKAAEAAEKQQQEEVAREKAEEEAQRAERNKAEAERKRVEEAQEATRKQAEAARKKAEDDIAAQQAQAQKETEEKQEDNDASTTDEPASKEPSPESEYTPEPVAKPKAKPKAGTRKKGGKPKATKAARVSKSSKSTAAKKSAAKTGAKRGARGPRAGGQTGNAPAAPVPGPADTSPVGRRTRSQVKKKGLSLERGIQ
ncbi:hypothetical protein BS50DRAFT_3813 [Corynespora cassiicola Philippines]|uniref:Uncharacterized protein n=1 Tax=Corynespora cassiicola Philippines TaxID=1448308 RepID=A0A2T2P8D0_CORCC|nr:hypothetical protein BS50DRAFT_3813 [Corynespora cassiicola Philippines]